MTWQASCPNCGGFVFELTHGSTEGVIHVNCGSQQCGTYIGKLDKSSILNMPAVVPH